MSSVSNQDQGPGMFSATAQRMLDLRDIVFSEWEKRVRATVKHADELPHPLLINTFPIYYASLAQVISPDSPRVGTTESNNFASEHGGERARLTNYSPQSVIAEYQLLRWTILDVLRTHDVHLNVEEFYTLNATIDNSVREAATAYALAQSALRERFVAALAHDLRNPLNNIMASAELMLRIDDLEKIKKFSGKIVENVRRMDRMTKEMLDCMQFQSGERLRLNLSRFDILDVAREVVEQAVANGDSRIQLTGASATGWWDRDAVKRTIENLVGNAMKYGFPDTPIRVHVDAQHERAVIGVHNMGEPIEPEQMDSVFQAFRRTHAAKSGNRQGWGMGLPYVRSVTESHGGSVGIESCGERGTTFLIDMPLDARPFLNKPTLSG